MDREKIFKFFHTNRKEVNCKMSEKILDVGAVTSKFQITLTKTVRDRFNFNVGDRVIFVEKDGELIVRKT